MHLGERPGAGPDPVGHQLVVDLLAELGDLRDGAAGHEGQRRVPAAGRRVGGLPATGPELELLPGESGQVGGGEELAGREAAGEVEDRRADHHRVVHVEERRCGEIGEGHVDGPAVPGRHGSRRGGLAGPDRGVVGDDGVEHPGRLAGPAQIAGSDGRERLTGLCSPDVRGFSNHVRASGWGSCRFTLLAGAGRERGPGVRARLPTGPRRPSCRPLENRGQPAPQPCGAGPHARGRPGQPGRRAGPAAPRDRRRDQRHHPHLGRVRRRRRRGGHPAAAGRGRPPATGCSSGSATGRRSAWRCSGRCGRVRSPCRRDRSRWPASWRSCSTTAGQQRWWRNPTTATPRPAPRRWGPRCWHRRTCRHRRARRCGWPARRRVAARRSRCWSTPRARPGGPAGCSLSHRALLANRAQTAALRPAPVTPGRPGAALAAAVPRLRAGRRASCRSAGQAPPSCSPSVSSPAHVAGVLVAAAGERGGRGALDVPRAARPPGRRAARRHRRPAAVHVRRGAAAAAVARRRSAPPPACRSSRDTASPRRGPVVTTNAIGGVAEARVGRPARCPGVELRLVDAEGRPLDAGGRR